MTYTVTKNLGCYSVVHRNWRADNSHCKFLHGYGRTVEIEVSSDHLTAKGWVLDFGGFQILRDYLQQNWDHCTMVEVSDPLLEQFKEFEAVGALQLTLYPDGDAGMEGQARMLHKVFTELMRDELTQHPEKWISRIKISENFINAGVFSHTQRSS